MKKPACRSLIASSGFVFAAAAHAAGGHFDVDDAAVLEPGHCQYETWVTRAPFASATAFHFSPGCRVGTVELALNYDRIATANGNVSAFGPQLKWVASDPLVSPLSFGVAWAVAWDLHHGGRPTHTLYMPVTWAFNDTLAFNANLGADWNFAGARTRRIGASAEWVAHERLTLVAERVKLAGEWTSRLGTRFTLTDRVTLDFSVARVSTGAARLYAIGLNHDFAR